MATKSVKISAIAPGTTSVVFETTKKDAVSASVTININVAAKEILTITSTTTDVSLIEGQETTIELTYSGNDITMKQAPDTSIATVTLQ